MSFAQFVGRNASSKYPRLDASLVDGLDKAGLVDPSPFLSERARKISRSAQNMFPDGINAVGSDASFTAGKRSAYLQLLVRHLRSGKVGLTAHAHASGSVFAVGKSGGRHREVWHGGDVSVAACRPPKPPHQIIPSALVHLETDRAHPFYVAKKDGTCFFDQLSLPKDLCRYMGRPRVHLNELLGVDGMTSAELHSYFLSGERVTDLAETITPVNLTWAMGFSWSSYVAQSVMTGCCMRAGATVDTFLAHDGTVPEDMTAVIGVATDDVMHFSNEGPDRGQAWMEGLENIFAAVGVVSNPSKDLVGSRNATCVGIDFVEGTKLMPQVSKLWD